MTDATKPTPEQLRQLRAWAQREHDDGPDPSRYAPLLLLLSAYETTQRPIDPAPSSSLRAVAEEVIASKEREIEYLVEHKVGAGWCFWAPAKTLDEAKGLGARVRTESPNATRWRVIVIAHEERV